MRQCGGCAECCTHIGVAELDKSAGITCKHVCPKGCEIYQDRPSPCRTWRCLWLDGHFSVNDRPDKTKSVCWITNSELMKKDGKNQPVMYLSHRPEVKPHKKTFRMLMSKNNEFPIIVIPGKGNNPKSRTIYWKGKKIVDNGKILEGK